MKTAVGTEDLTGAVVVDVGYNDVTLEKDGVRFTLELEYEADYNSFCEGSCSCCGSSGSSYFRAYKE